MSGSGTAAFVDDGRCFACGRDNDLGLKMQFSADENGVRSDLSLPHWLQGWAGVAHGGVVAMLLDEAMAHALGHSGVIGVTGKLDVRFRLPVQLDAPLVVRARVVEHRRRVALTEASLEGASGETLASASAHFMVQRALRPGETLGRG